MRKSDTFSVMLLPRFEKESKGKTPLYARITVNGKFKRFSIQIKVTTDLWEPSVSRLKGNSAEARQINNHINQVLIEINEAYRELKKERKLITPQTVIARYRGEDQIRKTLIQLSEYHKFNMKSVLKPGTLKNYYTTETYIKRFLEIQRKTDDIYLEHLDYAFIIDFENFLRRNVAQIQKSRPLTNNGVMKHLERLKKLLNLAVKLEWVERDPFAKFSLKFVKNERHYLSQKELDLLINTELIHTYQNRTKDIFIFSCYTGLSYIDVKNLMKNDIVKGIDGKDWIFTKRQKTDHPIKIPLLDVAENIIHKYKDEMKNSDKLLPVYSNQKLNKYLKEVAKELKINKYLTFHSARHTFATTVTLSNGVPIETVSKLLGHTKLSTTQIYAKVLESRISSDINNLRIVLNHQKELIKNAN
ncbi:site-specific integrase [Aequorivita sp. KMM 9714]|uniref:site-specific integrase n=1 Tax=Aequorivita sp. KMM 9714 TaxID=2707173 RepID=UPI0013EBC219|nr:site-specific integrase [Aequorivita sp. KMM 9714]NGX84861.1 site-specific integrase [Aequorivita sp. KMM 9714]